MSKSSPELSIVIPVYNGAEWILPQLEAVSRSLKQAPHAEILVVDNRSTDDSAALVSTWSESTGAPVRVVEAHDTIGEPHARNVGWQQAASQSIAYCDADDVVADSWAGAVAEALRNHSYVTGPIDTQELNPPELADLRGQSLFDSIPEVYGLVPYAHGCNMAFSRSVLETLGGFEETFLIGCDIELAIRAWRAEVDLTWDPGVLVHYRLRSSTRATYRQARSYGRVRHRLAALVPEADGNGEARSKRLGRIGWLAKHVPEIREPAGRAKWAWVAGQVVGEVEGYLRPSST
jgi:glycosyltransferase involved in cell wall biosynthesis